MSPVAVRSPVVGALGLVAALLAPGCSSRPYVAVEGGNLEGTVNVRISGVARGTSLEVCGSPQPGPWAVTVPFECVVAPTLPLEPRGDIDSKPIPVAITSFFGSKEVSTHVVKLAERDQERLAEGWLHAVLWKGRPLPRAEGRPAAHGIAVTGAGRVRGLDAKTIEDVALIVQTIPTNSRSTGKQCSYSNLMTGTLTVYDFDVEAFDAHTAKSVAKARLVNEFPGCPSTTYGRVGASTSVSSWPAASQVDAWARAQLKRLGT